LSLAVPIFNVVFSILLDLVSKCQRDKTLGEYYISYMIKAFILQVINTGVIITVSNMKIPKIKSWSEYFPFFTGEYTDFDPEWYKTVGSTIIFSMLMNIITPHLSTVLYFLVNQCKKCYDKFDKTKETKCKTRKEYLNIYLGPEFNISARYASILTNIMITLIFSPGMPILNIFLFIFLFITYWVDKCLLLRYYKYPPSIDLYLDKVINIVIVCGLLLHFLFAIWIYGNTYIVSNDDPELFGSVKNKFEKILNDLENDANFFSNSFKRFSYSHNKFMLLIFILFLLIIIFRIFCWNIFAKKFCKKFISQIGQIKNLTIYEAMDVDVVYKNYNLRKGRANQIQDEADFSDDDFSSMMEFLREKMRIDRKVIIDKLSNVSELNECYQYLKEYAENNTYFKRNINKDEFERNIPKIMRNIKKENYNPRLAEKAEIILGRDQQGKKIIRMIYLINRDYSYLGEENDKYKDFIYYYIYLPRSKRIREKEDNNIILKK
jgi:hypothetical protein